MPYVDKCQQLYRLFELVMLPAWVAVFVQPYGDLWRFLKYNEEAPAADLVAQFLVEVFLRASDIRARAVASSALTSWGLEPSQFLRQNHASLAEEMIRLFHSLEPWGPGRGRTSAAVAFFGGGAACRNMLKEVEDAKEKIKLATYVAGKLSEHEACILLGL